MVKFVLAMAIAAVATSADAYEIRCQTNYYWNSSYSRCVPWYSEQEIYQQNQAATVRDLNSSSRGGSRRASEAVMPARPRSRGLGRGYDVSWLSRMIAVHAVRVDAHGVSGNHRDER
jgi:hypothetical protein